MMKSYAKTYVEGLGANNLLLTLGVPRNEKWLLIELKATANWACDSTISVLVNGETKYSIAPALSSETLLINQEIPAGAEIVVQKSESGAGFATIGTEISIWSENV